MSPRRPFLSLLTAVALTLVGTPAFAAASVSPTPASSAPMPRITPVPVEPAASTPAVAAPAAATPAPAAAAVVPASPVPTPPGPQAATQASVAQPGASAPFVSAMQNPLQLSGDEAAMLKLKLAEAKPNVSTAAIISFLAPGSAQVYMGHVDRSLMIWGGYLIGFTAIKMAISPTATTFPGGPTASDAAVAALFLGVAAFSSLDAYLLAVSERADYDRLIDRLTDKQPLPPQEITRP